MSDRPTFTKDPAAVLDYRWDWSAWLAEGETITAATVTASAGLTVDSSAISGDGSAVTAWISGGTATREYEITNHITTSAGRQDDRTIAIKCMER